MSRLTLIFYLIDAYFIFYQIPKMMRRLTKGKKQSVLTWSLIGIAAWIVTGFFGNFIVGLVYGLGVHLWGWPKAAAPIFYLSAHAVGLAASIGSLLVVRRILLYELKDNPFDIPPPPP